MNFELTQEQELLQQAAHQFAQEEVAPKAAHWDETGEFPWSNIEALFEHGYLGMMIPEKYGGSGMGMLEHTLVVEELARACATTAVIFEVHNTLHCEPLINFGSDRLKEKYLPGLASGDHLGAFALTEPQAGSEAYNLQTRAVQDGDEWVLNGQKVFITNGGQADLYIVFAVTDPDAGKKGISAFIVEKEMEGLSFGSPERKMGIHGSHTTKVFFDDVRVPAENLVGERGEGYKIALATLDGGRIGIAAQALGITQSGFDKSKAYAKEREQFGQPIANFQAIQWKLAEMSTDLAAARMLLYRAAWLFDQGGRHSLEIAQAKLFCSEMALKHVSEAVQIHGGYGYIKEYGVERLMRDVKITQLYEGTSEVMHLVIAGFEMAD